jgi:hypothetical protein
MKRNVLLTVIIFLSLAHPAPSQTPCVELKNFEFFTRDTKERWSESALETLIKARPSADSGGWVVPVIVEQLARYEPACGGNQVDRKFELLLRLYATVRNLPRLEDVSLTPYDKLTLVRQDFQIQLNNDQGFARLIYTTDDGPLAGKPTSAARTRPVASRDHVAPFGKLRFSNTRTGVVVTALGRRGKVLWSRSLQGMNPKRALKEAQLETLSVEQTDFVVVARIVVDGERLTLYARPNGRFMYYYHSW